MYNVSASEDASAISHTIWIFRCNDIAFFIYFQVITFADKTCIWFVTSSDNDFIYRHNLEVTSTVDTSTIFVKSHHFVFEAFYLVFTFYAYWRSEPLELNAFGTCFFVFRQQCWHLFLATTVRYCYGFTA